ncbi:hypothetical protein [uncultured Duncaniella sp.]|uniref:hypothetical protein n=1 Tax=uncultured Duncaniella sp. TaxID=2768039 RepID=UPI00272AB294|nr:hypothetical protein [uncultured Duncaniella sp.]
MIAFQRYIRSCILLAAVVAINPLFCGCIGDDSLCTEEDGAGTVADGNVNLSFTIVTRHAPSGRAADISGGLVGSSVENFINISDIQFLLFDADRKFLQNFYPDVKLADGNTDYSEYVATVSIDEPYFDENIDGNVNFYIMALANGKSLGMSFPGAFPGVTTISDLCSAAGSPLLTEGISTSGIFDPQNGVGIPMSGLQYFSVAGKSLKESTPHNPYNLSTPGGGRDINMLRAVAKIEVIDRINIPVGEDYDADIYGESPDRITGVSLLGTFSSGSMFPAMDQWDRGDAFETQQVIAPTVPKNASWLNPPVFPDRGNINLDGYGDVLRGFAYDEYATGQRADKCRVYSAYVYEYSRAGIGTGHPPYLHVTVKGSSDKNDANYGPQVLPMRLTQTEGQVVTDLDALMRNHIYRYEITAISQGLEITWTLCPMDEVTIDIPPFN